MTVHARWPILLMLLLALGAVGCADNAASSDGDKRGGFYSGVSGGGAWP